MDNEKLIKEARTTVALITSFSKKSEFALTFPNLHEIFQTRAEKLNDTLGKDRFSWDDEEL